MSQWLPLEQWTWPAWIEDLAARSPDPDRHATMDSPDALDWVSCGLPSNPDQADGAYLTRGLPAATLSGEVRMLKSEERPSWVWDSESGGPSPVNAQGFGAGGRWETAFLVAMRRGANPWGWSPGTSSPSPMHGIKLFTRVLSAGHYMAARAMLAHPDCPDLGAVASAQVLSVIDGVRAFALPLAAACAHQERRCALELLVDAGVWSAQPSGNRPLESCRSESMVRQVLSLPGSAASSVFSSLIVWHQNPFSSLIVWHQNPIPDQPSSKPPAGELPSMVEAVREWWLSQGLGDESQWRAQLACAQALASGVINGQSMVPESQHDEWCRQVGSLEGVIWLAGSLDYPSSPDGSMRGVPASMAAQWLLDRSRSSRRWPGHPGESNGDVRWGVDDDRVARLERWKQLEKGLGDLGGLKEWTSAWSRFWAWAPPLSAWTSTEVSTARRLWALEDTPAMWPPKDWDLDAWDPSVLGALSSPIRQGLGEAFLGSMVNNPLARNPSFAALTPTIQAWGFRSAQRVRWAHAWLSTPGWTPPALSEADERALLAWPGKSGPVLVSMWRQRRMDASFDEPLPRLPRSRM